MRSEILALDRTESILSLVGRVLMSGLFFYSALGKIMAPENVATRIAEVGLPQPQVGYAGAVLVEVVIGLMFLSRPNAERTATTRPRRWLLVVILVSAIARIDQWVHCGPTLLVPTGALRQTGAIAFPGERPHA